MSNDEEVTTADPGAPAHIEAQLLDLVEIVENARAVPLSGSVMVDRDEVLEILDDITANLPAEIRAARWLLKEREEVRAKAQRDAEEIIADAKSHVARMVQRTEVVKAANLKAQHIVDEAEAEARRLRHEADDYCDQKLASFEVTLDRLAKTVAAGRRRLAATIAEAGTTTAQLTPGMYSDDDDSDAAAFFDQDLA
jgi:cell division septum initiation protein DivIVA